MHNIKNSFKIWSFNNCDLNFLPGLILNPFPTEVVSELACRCHIYQEEQKGEGEAGGGTVGGGGRRSEARERRESTEKREMERGETKPKATKWFF